MIEDIEFEPPEDTATDGEDPELFPEDRRGVWFTTVTNQWDSRIAVRLIIEMDVGCPFWRINITGTMSSDAFAEFKDIPEHEEAGLYRFAGGGEQLFDAMDVKKIRVDASNS